MACPYALVIPMITNSKARKVPTTAANADGLANLLRPTIGMAVFAAGLGTRMREETRDLIPKPLVSVGGKELIRHNLDLVPPAVTAVALIIGHHSDMMKEWADQLSMPYKVLTIMAADKNMADMTAQAAAVLRADHLIIANGDEVILNFSLESAINQHLDRGAIATTVMTSPSNAFGGSALFHVLGERGSVERAEFPDNVSKKELSSEGWLQNAGITILRKDAIRLLGSQQDWYGAIHFPLVNAGVQEAYIDRNIVYFNINSPSNIRQFNDYVSGRKPERL